MFPYTYSSSSPTSAATLEGSYSLPFLHFPWPFLDDVVDDGLLDSHDQNLAMIKSPLPSTDHPLVDEKTEVDEANMIISNGDGVPLKGLVHKETPWKKTGKNDRHSKIRTAQGLRDRRMRLSVKVARKFFDLQDMLDFDKASKTIEWLLKNSEPAIQELARNNKCVSSSASVNEEVSETNKEMEIMQITGEKSLVGTKPKEKRKRRRCYKAASVNPFARESRDKARARARQRTRERLMMLKTSKHHLEAGGDSAAADTNRNLEFPGFTSNEAGGHAMTSKKSSVGNNVQVQNIQNEIFITNPNYSQEHNSTPHEPSSIGEQWNPSSIFGITPNAQAEQNPIPNPNFMNINALELGVPSPVFRATNSNIGFHSHFLGNHFL